MLILPRSPLKCLRFVNSFFFPRLFGLLERGKICLQVLVWEAGGTTCKITLLLIKISPQADAAAACFEAGAGHKDIGWRDM